MCSWMAWHAWQRCLGTSPDPCVTPAWQDVQPTPRETYSECVNLNPAPTSIGFSGGLWHVVHCESFGSSSAPLKWQSRHVLVVTVRKGTSRIFPLSKRRWNQFSPQRGCL